MKLVSWNVNGLRACLTKGFNEAFKSLDADVVCLQEIKMEKGQAQPDLDGYFEYWNSAEKKGYSGTAIFTKKEPLSVCFGIGEESHDHEGRVITAEYDDFYLVNVYVPNSQRELARLSYRMLWEDAFKAYITDLNNKKPVIICGDMNVAHKPIDLKNPKQNERNAGFTPEERDKMSALLQSGFIDSFRYFYPDKSDAYSWWSYMARSRERNIGWRIDYFIVSEALENKLITADIHTGIFGSDHCPVELVINAQ